MGKIERVKRLLSSGMVDVNCIVGPHDETPLFYASMKGHKDVVKLLLDTGAEPSKEDKDGYTPLHEASRNGQTETAAILLDRGADINNRDYNV